MQRAGRKMISGSGTGETFPGSQSRLQLMRQEVTDIEAGNDEGRLHPILEGRQQEG